MEYEDGDSKSMKLGNCEAKHNTIRGDNWKSASLCLFDMRVVDRAQINVR